MGEAELCQVALGNAAAVAPFDQLGDAGQQVLAPVGLQRAVAGVGEQEIAICAGGVRLGPLVAMEYDALEETGLVELSAIAWDLGGILQSESRRSRRVPALVAGLGLREERRITTGDVFCTDYCQSAARPEYSGAAGDAHRRVQPVEGGRRDDRIKLVMW